jgi:hypothetical protein
MRAMSPTAMSLSVRAAKRALLAGLLATAATAAGIDVPANALIADGSFYSADPAPIVVGDELILLAGRDEAPPDVNDFIMREWQLFSTKDVASGRWRHTPGFLRPERVFAWAMPERAYASQIVRGVDGRFYLYAPVHEKGGTAADPFGIGVAVADSIDGPWRDAHPAGPIVSQTRPAPNKIHNIDPTVLVDDGRVFLYWGSFGELRGVELERDMVTPKGAVVTVRELDGFFEAPWLFRRGSTYYLAYAGNRAGPGSPCTPAIYHACIAYGTAPTPLGPWTYRGVILPPVSSTTSHPGIVEFGGRWYLAYHTADAKEGGHFRRSIALDELHWDDSVDPPRIRPVVPTRRSPPAPPPTRNIAMHAKVHVSNEPLPVKYWSAALNDGRVRGNPLPPEMWSTAPAKPSESWIEYRWERASSIDGSRIAFVAPPREWRIEYWTGRRWRPVRRARHVEAPDGRFVTTRFDAVNTARVRALFTAPGAEVAVQEWEVLATAAASPAATLPATPSRE